MVGSRLAQQRRCQQTGADHAVPDIQRPDGIVGAIRHATWQSAYIAIRLYHYPYLPVYELTD
jgi:hypothetical protein